MSTLAADLLTRNLALRPETLNVKDGTVDVVLTTGAPVRRGGYIERLAIGPENVSVAARVPLLDAHRQTSIKDIKGRVANVRHEAGQIVATLYVTDPEALAAIERGDVTGVSVGYRVSKWTESRDPRTGELTRTATTWELIEASLVPVPADPAAIIRGAALDPETVENPTPEVTSGDPPPTQTRAQVNAEIRSIATTAGLTSAFADGLIDREATVEQARAAAFEEMQRRSAQPITTNRVGPSAEDPAEVHTRMAEALACRMNGGTPSDQARPYMSMGLADMARAALIRRGEPGVAMLSREEVLTRAMHTTSDFPLLLQGAGNRVLLPAYQAASSPLKALARQTTADDFRPVSLIRVGEFGKLKKVTEAGEIKALTTGEAAEGYALETYGGIFSLSRKAMINDDLGAFSRWAAMMGRAAAETEADQLVQLLREANGAGPVMGDGKRLFHADHGNIAAAGADPSVDTLSEARQALRRQTGLDGQSPINAAPKYLVVAADLETKAEQVLAELSATTVGETNPFAGKLTLAVEPRLPDGDWYVFADPAILPVLEYAYLSSAQGPQMASRDGWDVLGREFRVVLDFGCGAVDWRGAYRNPGAADL
ncbi:prohead protease/major capsid protein fusion protein [Phenylobacterium sp.]|uniref:prohead protease/major capsid protein fusion protein n=1 Tax=Phenylobacterium sp. TaxID=1871053 RepID=UPI0035AECFD0